MNSMLKSLDSLSCTCQPAFATNKNDAYKAANASLQTIIVGKASQDM